MVFFHIKIRSIKYETKKQIAQTKSQKIERKKKHTFACTNKKETIGSNRTVKEINNWTRVTVTNKRHRRFLLFHFLNLTKSLRYIGGS